MKLFKKKKKNGNSSALLPSSFVRQAFICNPYHQHLAVRGISRLFWIRDDKSLTPWGSSCKPFFQTYHFPLSGIDTWCYLTHKTLLTEGLGCQHVCIIHHHIDEGLAAAKRGPPSKQPGKVVPQGALFCKSSIDDRVYRARTRSEEKINCHPSYVKSRL